MPLGPGARLGPYELTGSLGAGGMGEVFRARDPRLGREVAIKVIGGEGASDAAGRQRFQREARTIAALSHPNICAIHDVGTEAGLDYLVLELLPGESLAARLRRGPLPLDEALARAGEIAQAVDCAHRAGIVHRDLKPGNVMLTPTGAKVLDFGVARIARGETDTPQAPAGTITAPVTEAGVVLGTLPYMAPEQIEGRVADARSDVFAFGATLFEMLTGRRAFEASSTPGLIGAIVQGETPSLRVVKPDLPPALDRLVRTCLAKDPAARFASLHDVATALEWVQEDQWSGARSAADATSARLAPRGLSLATAVVGLTTALVGALASWWVWTMSQTESEPAYLDLVVPEGMTYTGLALSPDGRRLAFIADLDGRATLYLRDLHSDVAVAAPVAGTSGATHEFWSPDGRSIGFFADGQLKRLDVGSGAILTLSAAPNGRGATWSSDGTTILFAPDTAAGLSRVPSQGGEAVPVTTLQPHEIQHRLPQFLGDGTRFFFVVLADGTVPESGGVYLGDLEGTKPVRLNDTSGRVTFVPPDRIVYYVASSSSVVTQGIDLRSGRLVGERSTLAVNVGPGGGQGLYSVSANGVLAFRRVPVTSGSQLQWFSRSGPEGSISDIAVQSGIELAPTDGRWAAASRTVNGNTDIYVVDLSTGAARRLTSDAAPDVSPVWSPDGRTVYFASTRNGRRSIWRKSIDDDRPEAQVTDHQTPEPLDLWNDTLLFKSARGTRNSILSRELSGAAEPVAVAAFGFTAQHGQISPDGQWMAYSALRDVGMSVWVKRLGADGPGRQVTTGGGTQPRWSHDGRVLYYVSPSRELIAIPMTLRADGFDAGTAVPLFRIPLRQYAGNNSSFDYDVARDGRFLVNADRTTESPITIVLNWVLR
jgi:Tol biopolymer transport system component